METVTGFGDSAVTLPLALVILIWLARASGRRAAFAWLAALLLCGGLTAMLKIYFGACAGLESEFHSPSGHARTSTLVYGGFALVGGIASQPRMRIAIGALGRARTSSTTR